MGVYQLPDGKLVVPKRAEGGGVIGDGMVVLSKTDKEYKEWVEWLEKSGTKPKKINKWPLGK